VYINIFHVNILNKGDGMKRANRKRLSVDVPEDLFKAIKFSAQLRNITITRWVLRACFARIKDEQIIEDI
jgi:hypothetical protein